MLAPAVSAMAVPRIVPLLERRYVLPPKVAVAVSNEPAHDPVT